MKKVLLPWLFRLRAMALGVACATALLPVGLMAGPRDHDKVHRAVESGEIRALADILAAIRDKLPGQVTGIEVEQKNGRWIYEFRVVDGKGQLFDVYVDARSGEIDRIKEK